MFLGQTLAAARGFSTPSACGDTLRASRNYLAASAIRRRNTSCCFSQWNVAFSRGNVPRSEELAHRSARDDGRGFQRHSPTVGASGSRHQPGLARASGRRRVQIWSARSNCSIAISISPCSARLRRWCRIDASSRGRCGFAAIPIRRSAAQTKRLQLAMRLGRPFSIAFALQYMVSVAHLRRSYEGSWRSSRDLNTVARENGFPIWQACGTASIGRVLDGRRRLGGRRSALMREGLQQARNAGGELIYHLPAVAVR